MQQPAAEVQSSNSGAQLNMAREQQINRDMNMLDAWNDPLSVGAQKREAPKPLPPAAPAVLEPAVPRAAASVEESSDQSADAFKAEVERMVRAEIAKEQLDQAAHAGFKADVDEMIKTTIAPDRLAELNAQPPPGTASNVAALLASLGLEQYTKVFE